MSTISTISSMICVLALNTVPSPSVNVSALNTQTVGQSLTLECNVTTVRGITSRVSITWSSNDTELNERSFIPTPDNSGVYTSTYTIPQLSLTHNDTEYQCVAMISTTIIRMDDVTLDLIS